MVQLVQTMLSHAGYIAQMVERSLSMREVQGSIPCVSMMARETASVSMMASRRRRRFDDVIMVLHSGMVICGGVRARRAICCVCEAACVRYVALSCACSRKASQNLGARRCGAHRQRFRRDVMLAGIAAQRAVFFGARELGVRCL